MQKRHRFFFYLWYSRHHLHELLSYSYPAWIINICGLRLCINRGTHYWIFMQECVYDDQESKSLFRWYPKKNPENNIKVGLSMWTTLSCPYKSHQWCVSWPRLQLTRWVLYLSVSHACNMPGKAEPRFSRAICLWLFLIHQALLDIIISLCKLLKIACLSTKCINVS